MPAGGRLLEDLLPLTRGLRTLDRVDLSSGGECLVYSLKGSQEPIFVSRVDQAMSSSLIFIEELVGEGTIE